MITTENNIYFMRGPYLCHRVPELLNNADLLSLAQLQAWEAGCEAIGILQTQVKDELGRRGLLVELTRLVLEERRVPNN